MWTYAFAWFACNQNNVVSSNWMKIKQTSKIILISPSYNFYDSFLMLDDLVKKYNQNYFKI